MIYITSNTPDIAPTYSPTLLFIAVVSTFQRGTTSLFSGYIKNLNKMERWSGRVALITGSYSGIGNGVTQALVKHGMNVIGCARNFEKLFLGTNSLPMLIPSTCIALLSMLLEL